MNKELLPRNWLIVDDHVEDAKLIAQSIPEGSKTVDIAHDLETAEYQLRGKSSLFIAASQVVFLRLRANP